MNKNRLLFFVLALGLLLVSFPALAHHGVAGYDMTRTITLHGTVTKFDWSNPHCVIHMDAKNAAGMAANPLDRLDLALGRAVAYVCGGVVNGRAGLTDLIAVLAIFGLSAWAMVWVSRKLFSGTP